jgi:biopolymer transport protein TolQ
MNGTEVVQAGLGAAGNEITLWSMFWHAHFVVKFVMLGLMAASVWSWAIIIDKSLFFHRSERAMDRFEEVFWSGQSLEELYQMLVDRPAGAMAAVFVAAMREWKRAVENPGRSFANLGQRIDKVLDVTIQRERERFESKLLVLATIGSASPFIGLFGTVWGIMNSFQSLGNVHQATLAMVAPGISEALVATAMGLFAAIPAVVAYNRFASDIDRIFGRYDIFAEEFLAILRRQAHD